MGVLPIALGLPGTICFLPVLTHHRSPSGCVIEAAYAEKGIIACHLPYGNSGLTSPTACFVDSLLVWKFDRFARSVTHLLQALEDFHHLGIRFVSLQDQIDTQSPLGKALFTIIGAMAELEAALIAERVKAGMAAAKARGKPCGRPATPAHLVARVEALAGTTGLSIRHIHQVLEGRGSRSVIGAIFKPVRHPPSLPPPPNILPIPHLPHP